jgi:glycosyltransferase involved in cell wall biosynthesis
MRRVLLIAFQFPPFSGSSAIQRTLRFVQHLPRHSWEPLVLSAAPTAYEATSDDLMASIPPGTIVERARALDAARHLAIAGRYPGFLARPDRWFTWSIGGAVAGRRMIARYRPSVLWSTYPIATAHLLAAKLQRASGLPWVADFRDPMAQDGYPADPATWRAFDRIERATVGAASFSVFTTPGAAAVYRGRYGAQAERMRVIENGYDEETFSAVQGGADNRAALAPGRLTLLHSGVVYPDERDPRQLMAALAMLKADGTAGRIPFAVRFRASGHDAMLMELARSHDVAGLIELLPSLPYAKALDEMLRADALLVLQAANCNQQIPAKLYEYLRAGRPVLGLTDPAGDTAATLRAAGVRAVAPLDDANAIAACLRHNLADLARGEAALPDAAAARRNSRAARAAELAALLDAAADTQAASAAS